jgi:hypothetical protein
MYTSYIYLPAHGDGLLGGESIRVDAGPEVDRAPAQLLAYASTVSCSVVCSIVYAQVTHEKDGDRVSQRWGGMGRDEANAHPNLSYAHTLSLFR